MAAKAIMVIVLLLLAPGCFTIEMQRRQGLLLRPPSTVLPITDPDKDVNWVRYRRIA